MKTNNAWQKDIIISPSEWFEWFIKADRDLNVTFDNGIQARIYVVGRQDSLTKGKYDGEYINIELRTKDNQSPDPDYEIAMDPWSSIQKDLWCIWAGDEYSISIFVDEAGMESRD